MWVACFLAQTPAAACLFVRSLPGGANTTSIAYLLRGQHVLPSPLQCPTEVLQVFSSVQCSAADHAGEAAAQVLALAASAR